MNMLDGLRVTFYGGNTGSKLINGVIVQTQMVSDKVGTPYFELAIMNENGGIFIKSSYEVNFGSEDINRIFKTPDIMINRIREEEGSMVDRFKIMDIRDE